MKKIILSFVLVNLLTACSLFKSKEDVPEPVAAAPVVAVEPAPVAVVEPTPVAVVEPVAAPAAAPAAPEVTASTEPAAENGSVFFPFDVDAVQAADRATVQTHGAYLSKNKTAKVRVEGNADERGSSEYNLALGQRRANNVKKLLVLSGAKSSQVETVSFGEEKPRGTGHDESSWSQNRRADIGYSSK
jgi:peptidoglycan-associated lipoprotein